MSISNSQSPPPKRQRFPARFGAASPELAENSAQAAAELPNQASKSTWPIGHRFGWFVRCAAGCLKASALGIGSWRLEVDRHSIPSTSSPLARIPTTSRSGSAGTIARAYGGGVRVGLCDLTARRAGLATARPSEREREAEAARVVLGAAWRVNLRWPDGGIAGADAADRRRRAAGAAVRGRARWRIPYWDDRHPDHRAASEVLTARASSAAACGGSDRRYADAWRPEWICYYFINDSVPPSFASTSRRTTSASARRSRVIARQFTPREPAQRRHAADLAALPAADREP